MTLSSISPEITQLTKLEVSGLDSNQLTTLPECIGSLKNLQTLSVLFNYLTSLPRIGNQFLNIVGLDRQYVGPDQQK